MSLHAFASTVPIIAGRCCYCVELEEGASDRVPSDRPGAAIMSDWQRYIPRYSYTGSSVVLLEYAMYSVNDGK